MGRCVLEATWGRLVSLRSVGASLRWTEARPGSSAPQCLPWLKPALSPSGRQAGGGGAAGQSGAREAWARGPLWSPGYFGSGAGCRWRQ